MKASEFKIKVPRFMDEPTAESWQNFEYFKPYVGEKIYSGKWVFHVTCTTYSTEIIVYGYNNIVFGKITIGTKYTKNSQWYPVLTFINKLSNDMDSSYIWNTQDNLTVVNHFETVKSDNIIIDTNTLVSMVEKSFNKIKEFLDK